MHSQGVCIYFITKRPVNSPRITFNFSKKLYFQANNGIVSMLYTLIEHALSTALSARVISELYSIKKTVQVKSDFACLSYSFYTGSLAVRKKVIDWTLTEYQSGWRRSDRYVDGLTMGDSELTTCVGELTWRSVTKCTRSIFFSGGVPNISNLKDSCQCPFHFHLR